MGNKKKGEISLNDGSRIAVIGGGPAGSYFTLFAFDLASRMGLEIEIDIFETKSFSSTGPAGCNHCGGIVSESLVQALSAEGIILPSDVIRRGIESYTMHLEQGSTVINTPFKEQRIASMFRGAGPLGSQDKSRKSFDGYLKDLCKKKGAGIRLEKVKNLERVSNGIWIVTDKSDEKYDLVVGASGLNQKTFSLYQKIIPDFIPPKLTKTYISEFKLGNASINQKFGNSMHVFLLNLNNIKFGALIPKGEYVTLVLLGSSIDKSIVDAFINSETVQSCFGENSELKSIKSCQCFPSINITEAKNPFDDRIVIIGDSSSSKLYKNGIGAAYITGKAAAKTIIFDGISKEDFQNSFAPVCKKLNFDNKIGKFIFLVTTIIQKSSLLKKALFRMVSKEQTNPKSKKRMSSVLWDTFTGSASYQSIFIRVLHPQVLSSLLWNTIISIFNSNKIHI